MSVEAHKVQIFQDHAMEWRWSARDSNGAVVGVSGEGYVNKDFCIDAARSMFPYVDADQVYEDLEAIDDIELPQSKDARYE